MTGFVKVTVDFLVMRETPEDAKEYLDSIMRVSSLPNYTIRPDTEITTI